jgi:hypothetical protein
MSAVFGLLIMTLAATARAAGPGAQATSLVHQLHTTLRTQLDRSSPERSRAIFRSLLEGRRIAPEGTEELPLSQALALIERAREKLPSAERAAFDTERERLLRDRLGLVDLAVDRTQRVDQRIAATKLPTHRILREQVQAFTYSTDGSRFAVADWVNHESGVSIRDAKTGAVLHRIELEASATSIGLSPDLKYVATSQGHKMSSRLEVHEIATAKLVLDVGQRTSPDDGRIHFLPKTRNLVDSNFFTNWFVRLGDGARKPSILSLGQGLIAVSPREGPFARISLGRAKKPWLELRSAETGEPLSRVAIESSEVDSFSRAALSPDGRTLAITGFDQKLLLIDVRSGRLLAQGRVPYTNDGGELTFTADGRTVADLTPDGGLSLHRVLGDASGVRLEPASALEFMRGEWDTQQPFRRGLQSSADGHQLHLRDDSGLVNLDLEPLWGKTP